jgi:hypothetical protein
MTNFGQAIEKMKNGHYVARQRWLTGTWIHIESPDNNSKMKYPYIYMRDIHGLLFPWNPNNIDMLAEDWMVV